MHLFRYLFADAENSGCQGNGIDVDFEFDVSILEVRVVLRPALVSLTGSLGRHDDNVLRTVHHGAQRGVPCSAESFQVSSARPMKVELVFGVQEILHPLDAVRITHRREQVHEGLDGALGDEAADIGACIIVPLGCFFVIAVVAIAAAQLSASAAAGGSNAMDEDAALEMWQRHVGLLGRRHIRRMHDPRRWHECRCSHDCRRRRHCREHDAAHREHD
mmetsp:Transcript_6376/g.18756  ORF Transcript_6376/g.18756 Transcript_6376/m.18756 type:complete len:218 (+) Transcript_6376:908-1561(+)